MVESYERIERGDSLYDSQALKDTLQSLAPLDEAEDQAMRARMVDAVLAGESMQGAFPAARVSEATDRFLYLTTDAELAAAKKVLDQRALLQVDPAGFLASLCEGLAAGEQQICQERLAHMQAARKPQNQWFLNVLLRSMNGEGTRSIGQDYGLSYSQTKNMLKDLRVGWHAKDAERMKGITGRLKRGFPALQASIVEGLPVCVPHLNTELDQLAIRLSDTDYAHLARSLVDMNANAQRALAILMSFNVPLIRSIPPDHPLANIDSKQRVGWVTDYDRHLRAFRHAYRVRLVPRREGQQPRPPVYEKGDAASKIIYEALAAERDPLTAEEIVEYAKALEVGVYVKRLLADGASPSALPEEDAKELRQLVALGDVALQALLATHARFVKQMAWKYKYMYNSQRDVEELVVAGMRGLFRAVRRYDYARGYRLTSYASPVIRTFIVRDIITNDWRVGTTRAEQLLTLKKSEEMLIQRLQRQPTAPELAQESDFPEEEVQKLLQLEREIKLRAEAEYKDEGWQTTRGNVFLQSQSLKPEIEDALRNIFQSSPEIFEVLKMHIAENHTTHEISNSLRIPLSTVQARLQKAFSMIRKKLSAEEIIQAIRGVDANIDDETLR